MALLKVADSFFNNLCWYLYHKIRVDIIACNSEEKCYKGNRVTTIIVVTMVFLSLLNAGSLSHKQGLYEVHPFQNLLQDLTQIG